MHVVFLALKVCSKNYINLTVSHVKTDNDNSGVPQDVPRGCSASDSFDWKTQIYGKSTNVPERRWNRACELAELT